MTGSACIPGSVSSLYGQHIAGPMHEVASAGRRLAVNTPSRMALTPSCPSERASYAPTLQHMERRWATLLAVVCSPFTNHESQLTLAVSGLLDRDRYWLPTVVLPLLACRIPKTTVILSSMRWHANPIIHRPCTTCLWVLPKPGAPTRVPTDNQEPERMPAALPEHSTGRTD